MARRGENIRKRKDGRWEGRYTIKMADGKSKSKSVYAKTYSEARNRLTEAKQAGQKQSEESCQYITPAQNRDILIAQVADDWLQEILKTRKYSTYVKYRTVYFNHINEQMGNRMVTELKNQRADILLFSEDEAVSESTKQTVYSVLGQIVKFAEKKYRLPAIAFEKPVPKRKKKEIEIFNTSEQAGLFQFLTDNTDVFKMGILLCFHTGLRLGELCALKWCDIDFKGKVLHVNRTVQRIATDGGEKKQCCMNVNQKAVVPKGKFPCQMPLLKNFLIIIKTAHLMSLVSINPWSLAHIKKS